MYSFCEYLSYYGNDFQSKCRLAQSKTNTQMNYKSRLLKCTADQPAPALRPRETWSGRPPRPLVHLLTVLDFLKPNTLHSGL